MLSEMIDKIAAAISRRRFLGRAASACSSVVLAMLGFPNRVNAQQLNHVACCFLCSTTSCQNVPSCAGTWCWTCVFKFPPPIPRCIIFSCIECYNSNAPHNCFAACAPCGTRDMCATACENILCSKAVETGTC